MSSPPKVTQPRLVYRVPDEDEDEELQKPLEWGLIRRLIAYTGR